MSAVISAIETAYAGQLFRSRLEARWAVFFDCLGIAWKYEPRGFESSAGGRYLPDFLLPELAIWCEVKGDSGGMRREHARLCKVLQPDGPLPLLLLGEVPIFPSGVVLHPLLHFEGDRGLCRSWAGFLAPTKSSSRAMPLLFDTRGADSLLVALLDLPGGHHLERSADADGWRITSANLKTDVSYPAALGAYAAARHARFEHGQSGEAAVTQYQSARVLGRL